MRQISKRWKRHCGIGVIAMLMAFPAWGINLQEAARKVAKEHNARVLSAKTVNHEGKRVHEIKVVTGDGVVKTVRVPENS